MSADLTQAAPLETSFTNSLAAVANPVRVVILQRLRSPKALSEIKVHAQEEPPSGTEQGRLISRQAVRTHLEKLMEAGVIVSQEGARDYGATVEYTVNQPALFRLAERFRELAQLQPIHPPDQTTIQREDATGEVAMQRPCLVLVKGLDEGRIFPLTDPDTKDAQWFIGRRRGLDVSLEYDPFLSTDNSVIRRVEGEWSMEDLMSRNGTTRDFRPVPPGRAVPLRDGDLIGVGRSLLLFRA